MNDHELPGRLEHLSIIYQPLEGQRLLLGTVLPFDDERRMVRSHPKTRCWVEVALWVWLSLAAGWIWVIISAATQFQVPSSGAVLVGASVLAELAFEREQREWAG